MMYSGGLLGLHTQYPPGQCIFDSSQININNEHSDELGPLEGGCSRTMER